MSGLPFTGANLQTSVVSFDEYILIVGEDADEEKQMYYFHVIEEKWYDVNGVIPCSFYNPPTECPGAIDYMCKIK